MIIFIIKKSKQISASCLSVCCLKQIPTSTTCNWRQKESILPAAPYREAQTAPEGKPAPPRHTLPSSVLISLSPLIIWGAHSQQACNTNPSAKCLKIPNTPAKGEKSRKFPVWHFGNQNNCKICICRKWWAINGSFNPLSSQVCHAQCV